ncbi:alpha-L-rhamnosidase C-terminal domain-containing protein [Streptomyces sp. NPDC047939]|uniref:alpha-L-rhamnosidase C-terminal domain-containing protein n=1 Tax=Streptomyces sp. NPDC047939 TaxID=3155381 RepID=UPI00342558D9
MSRSGTPAVGSTGQAPRPAHGWLLDLAAEAEHAGHVPFVVPNVLKLIPSEARAQAAHGRVECGWRRRTDDSDAESPEVIDVDVRVPDGIEADVVLPDGSRHTVAAGHHTFHATVPLPAHAQVRTSPSN